LSIGVAVLVYDGFIVHDPKDRICAEDMTNWVLKSTGYKIQWDTKELDDTIKNEDHLNDEIVAGRIMKSLAGRILNCCNILFAYNATSGLWKLDETQTLMIQEAIDD
jgi:hypothetical protein